MIYGAGGLRIAELQRVSGLKKREHQGDLTECQPVASEKVGFLRGIKMVKTLVIITFSLTCLPTTFGRDRPSCERDSRALRAVV